ncbi:MAG TPA: OstA-like protein, partial [Prolixibacteraceae bacterium]|nr:OstA-like protein [Prolixibacteraceae bacterium]
MIAAFHVVSGSLPQPDSRKKRIEILNSDLYTYDAKIIANADRLIGNVALSHNNVLLYCDSAYSYKDSNMVDAFGHVHIVQGDTLNLYGDRIKYEGNSKIARVKGNVKLINKSIVLTTDELIFDLRANVGNYHTWGKIVDTANVLVSKIGRYYSNEDLFFFKDSVKVTNKDFILTADTLKYNSKTERVFIVGPTHIVGTTKQGTLYSEKGWYDTRTNIAELYKASKIIGKEQSLQGDTIFYSRSAGTGMARSRVLLSDTTNHVAITGRKGIYNEKTKIAFVTDSAVFMQFSPKDTLYLHADTLKSIPDVAKKEAIKKAAGKIVAAKKSVQAKPDTTKSVQAKPDTTKFLPAKTDTTKSFT